jgi:hypothetical protein
MHATLRNLAKPGLRKVLALERRFNLRFAEAVFKYSFFTILG